jgi:predicted ATPase
VIDLEEKMSELDVGETQINNVSKGIAEYLEDIKLTLFLY